MNLLVKLKDVEARITALEAAIRELIAQLNKKGAKRAN